MCPLLSKEKHLSECTFKPVCVCFIGDSSVHCYGFALLDHYCIPFFIYDARYRFSKINDGKKNPTKYSLRDLGFSFTYHTQFQVQSPWQHPACTDPGVHHLWFLSGSFCLVSHRRTPQCGHLNGHLY